MIALMFIGAVTIVVAVFFIMPFWIMHVAQGLFLMDWSHHYWLIIQAQLIIGFLTNHSNTFKKG